MKRCILKGMETNGAFCQVLGDFALMPRDGFVTKLKTEDEIMRVIIYTIEGVDVYLNGYVAGSDEPVHIIGRSLPDGKMEFYLAEHN